jgi:3-phosphoshikimate 1-carboxyvinyltransferase
VGVGGLLQPETALDMGNSGTSTRLLMGLVAAMPSPPPCRRRLLSKRPMGRVIDPLSTMGASSPLRRPPAADHAPAPSPPCRSPIACRRLGPGEERDPAGGLNTPGITTVIEPVPTRDHSERMLQGFGAI